MEADVLEAANLCTPTKGRPREFCVDQALMAALRVFWTKGFDGASLTDLTEAMGITRPSLYAAFGNKESLFRKALDLYESEKLAFLGAALDAPTARQAVERLLRETLKLQTSSCDPRGCLSVVAAVACSEFAPSLRDTIMARRASAERLLVDRFRRAVEEGDLPPAVDPLGLARLLSATMSGMAVQARGGATAADLSLIVDTALEMWPSR